MNGMFQNAINFNQPLDTMVTSGVSDMSYMFNGALNFNNKIFTSTSKVTNMMSMFQSASSFNQAAINNWSVSSVTDFTSMFENAVRFSQDIDNWSPSAVSLFDSMFKSASQFDGKMFTATTQTGAKMESMFENAVFFSGKNINNLQTSTVTSMKSMFKGATVFNSECTHSTTSKQTVWNVALVTDFTSMFEEARSFNKAISTWPFDATTARVVTTGFNSMFKNAAVFNNGIFQVDSNTASQGQADVNSLESMFEGAAGFNQDLHDWTLATATVDDTTGLQSMFSGASKFQQNLCSWQSNLDANNQPTTNNMFLNTRCPPANADVDLDDIATNADDNLVLGTVCCTCSAPNTDDATLYPACVGAATN